MGCDFFNGNENTCGISTSGGTESILFACLAYRNRGYKMGITDPEM
jgi:sphinganine-1-phosphate aldolase